MKVSKCALAIIIILGIIVITLNNRNVEAQSNNIPKPNIPDFTIHLEAHPYYVPPKYEINPYTGENRTIHTGYTVENKSLVIKIKNQPFTPYIDIEGNLIELFYNIHIKGHYEDYWTDLGIVNSSDTEYTIKAYSIGENAHYEILGALDIGYEIDLRARTQIGEYIIEYAVFYPVSSHIEGETSDWSNIQTLTIGEFQTFTPSPTPIPTSTPTPDNQQTLNTETTIGIIIIIAVLGAGIGLIIYLLKKH